MWRIWWAPNNVSRWQMGINSVFKGLMYDDVEAYQFQQELQILV